METRRLDLRRRDTQGHSAKGQTARRSRFHIGKLMR